MVTIYTGWKQQVREISNAIAFLFVARHSVICYLGGPRGKSRAREFMHAYRDLGWPQGKVRVVSLDWDIT